MFFQCQDIHGWMGLCVGPLKAAPAWKRVDVGKRWFLLALAVSPAPFSSFGHYLLPRCIKVASPHPQGAPERLRGGVASITSQTPEL